MPGLSTPQQQAGVMSFYDAQTNGPKINPKLALIFIAAFVVIVLIVDHVAFA